MYSKIEHVAASPFQHTNCIQVGEAYYVLDFEISSNMPKIWQKIHNENHGSIENPIFGLPNQFLIIFICPQKWPLKLSINFFKCRRWCTQEMHYDLPQSWLLQDSENGFSILCAEKHHKKYFDQNSTFWFNFYYFCVF